MPTLISAADAARRIDAGATLIDIREAGEFAREHVSGALNVPRDTLAAARLPAGPLIFSCRSGGRTGACAAEIASLAGPDAMIMDGGLMAWQSAGLPVAIDRSQPIDIMRQVQIAAGLLILTGVLLSLLVAPAFLGLSAFVGAGLLFAGLSGWCGMARLLALMPWNRQAA